MLLGIVIILIVGYLASRAIQDARSRSWAGPRTPAMRSRAASPSPRRALGPASRTAARSTGAAVLHPAARHHRAQAKADVERMIAETGLADWLEERREDRAARRERREEDREERREERARRARAAPAPQAAPAAPQSPAAGQPPGPPSSPQPAPSGSNGGTPVATGTSTAGAEQLIEVVDRLAARAMAGNILTKREVLLALHEGFTRCAAALQGVARDMAEPGSNYGPEITEPIAKAGTQQQASAMCLADADAALVALLTRSVAEMAGSSQRTPHHQNELSENGAR